MSPISGNYQEVYIKRNDTMVSLKDDVTDFCEKYIKSVHPENWDWSIRDFNEIKNDPTLAEARAIRNVLYKDMLSKIDTEVDLTTIVNKNALLAYFNPSGGHEEFNMEEFAFALKVELEHGKIRDTNVTNNHPFLTAMIVLAHMTETLTYYKRLKVMETEGEIFEIMRKIQRNGTEKDKWLRALLKAEEELIEAREGLTQRLDRMDDIPVLEDIGD